MLSAGYEKEQAELEQSIKTCREQLTQYDEDTDRTEEFLALVHKYTDITELTPVIINEFVDKILVHKAEKIDGERVMEIEIYLNFIGKVELPAQELTEEELAEIKENKDFVSAMPCIRGGAGQSSCQNKSNPCKGAGG